MELEDRDVERSTAFVIASAALRAYGAALLALGLCGLLAWCVASLEPFGADSSWPYSDPWLLVPPLTRLCAGVWLLRGGVTTSSRLAERALRIQTTPSTAAVTWLTVATSTALVVVVIDGVCRLAIGCADPIDVTNPIGEIVRLHAPRFGPHDHPGWLVAPLLRIVGAGIGLGALPALVRVWSRWNAGSGAGAARRPML